MSTLRKYAALMRGPDGGLMVGKFSTAAEAAGVAAEREVGRGGRGIHSAELARRIGVHPRTVLRAWQDGKLPGARQGARKLMIPHHVARLVERYGLLGVAGMVARGQL